MGVVGKLEVEVDIEASGDVFHELFGSKPHNVPDIVPHKIHACDVHHGEFGKPGSILSWDYTIDGKRCVAMELVEEIDEEKKKVKFKLLEGSDLLKEFKSMSISLHVVPKGDIDAVLWVIEFEKFDDLGHYPTALMDYIVGFTRDIAAHHVK